MTVAMPTVTVRELIRARLELELERFREQAAERGTATWLVIPGAGARPRGSRARSRQPDIEAMVGVALAGFERNRFFVLVNDRQVTALDEVVPLADATEVTFLHLTPLRGG
ncbi:MAG: hypothetical protein WDN04_25920 [Rhodospirillales bacterium]